MPRGKRVGHYVSEESGSGNDQLQAAITTAEGDARVKLVIFDLGTVTFDDSTGGITLQDSDANGITFTGDGPDASSILAGSNFLGQNSLANIHSSTTAVTRCMYRNLLFNAQHNASINCIDTFVTTTLNTTKCRLDNLELRDASKSGCVLGGDIWVTNCFAVSNTNHGFAANDGVRVCRNLTSSANGGEGFDQGDEDFNWVVKSTLYNCDFDSDASAVKHGIGADLQDQTLIVIDSIFRDCTSSGYFLTGAFNASTVLVEFHNITMLTTGNEGMTALDGETVIVNGGYIENAADISLFDGGADTGRFTDLEMTLSGGLSMCRGIRGIYRNCWFHDPDNKGTGYEPILYDTSSGRSPYFVNGTIDNGVNNNDIGFGSSNRQANDWHFVHVKFISGSANPEIEVNHASATIDCYNDSDLQTWVENTNYVVTAGTFTSNATE